MRTGTSNIFGTGRLQVYSLSGAIGASTLNAAANAALGAPWSITLPNAPQLGSAALIETNDDRILSAVYQDGRIWCTHSVGTPTLGATRTSAKFWELYPTTGLTRQNGLLDLAGTSFYYPSLVVNDQGLMMLSCSGSSAAEYVSCYYAWRNPDSPMGTLAGFQRYHAGAGPYNGPRWGDYSGTYLDPLDGTSIWVLQQHGEVSNRWGIRWAQLTIAQLNVLPVAGAGVLVILVLLLISVASPKLRRYILGSSWVR